MYFLYARSNEIEKSIKGHFFTYDFNKLLFNSSKKVKYIEFNYNKNLLIKINNKVNNSYKIQLNNLTKYFNFKNKVKYNFKYYENLLGYWLIHYLSQFYFKESVINLTKCDFKLIGTYYKHDLRTENISQFLALQIDDEYQNYLFTEVLNLKNIKHEKIFNHSFKIKYNSNNFFKIIFKRFLISFVSFLNPDIIFTDPYFKFNKFLNRFKLFWYSKFKIFFFNFENYYFSISKNMNKIHYSRSKLKIVNESLLRLILKNIPASELNSLNIKINHPSILYKTKKFCSSNAHYHNIYLKHFIANNRKEVKLYVVQHGSGYGDENPHIPENYDLSISDKFFYLRPKLNQKNFILPRIQKKKIRFNLNSNIYFISTSRHKYFIRPVFTGDIRNFFVKDNNILFNFYKLSNLRKKIFFRLHHIENYSNSLFFDSLKKSDIKLDLNTNIYISFKNARACVFDHIGTSFYESMSLSIPSIVILNNNRLLYYQKNFLKIFKLLVKANIIFFSTLDAAKFLDYNYKDIDTWWNSKIVIDARNIFTNNNSQLSEFWYKNWISNLNE